MSSKKSKLDLLVRVRYSNPLPPPPCPPKLLEIPTNPLRYTRPEFLNDIASDMTLPMIVDAECGMPLDLSRFECLWEEGTDDSELNPDPSVQRDLDPKDQLLLLDPSTSILSFGASASGTSTPTSVPNVSWLRKVDTRERDTSSRVFTPQEPKIQIETPIDVSHAAQIRMIESSFAALSTSDLNTLKHPSKPHLTAVDSYDLLPDAGIWSNAYDLFRFSERPGDRQRPPEEDDPRLDCAVFRPMESDGDHFLAYYLPKEDESAIEFKHTRLTRSFNDEQDQEEEPTPFHFVRDYEVSKVEQEVTNEYLFVIDEGDGEAGNGDGLKPSRPRPKGAYYKNIERKMILKKKRVNTYDPETTKWHIIRLKHTKMSEDEERERAETAAEVVDPSYLLNSGDADAEGEVEVDEPDAEGEHHEMAEVTDIEPIDPLDAL